MSAYQGAKEDALDAFMTFGGMPQILSFNHNEMKIEYLKNLKSAAPPIGEAGITTLGIYDFLLNENSLEL